MLKKILTISMLLLVGITAVGCKEEEVVLRQETKPQKYEKKEEETTIRVMNLDDKTTKKYEYKEEVNQKKKMLDNNEKIKYNKQKMTYGDLLKIVNEDINSYTRKYKCNDELVFNYIEIGQNRTSGNSIKVTRKESQENQDNFKQEIITEYNDLFEKEVLELKKDEESGKILRGYFDTRELDKEVKYEFEDAEDDDEKLLLLSDKSFDYGNLFGFYSFNDIDNYKGRGKIKLKDFKELIGMDYALEIIKDEEKTVKVKAKDGTITEKTLNPSDVEFEYDLTKEKGTIRINIDFTKTMETYCKYYAEYGINKATYKIDLKKENYVAEDEESEENSENESEVVEESE